MTAGRGAFTREPYQYEEVPGDVQACEAAKAVALDHRGNVENVPMNDKCAAQKSRADIIAGIHDDTAARVAGLTQKINIRTPVIMTGGVAKNTGVVKALENRLGSEILVGESPGKRHHRRRRFSCATIKDTPIF